MDKNKKQLIYCADVITLHHFISALGINIPRGEIRAAMIPLQRYPIISVKDVINTLKSFNIDSFAFRTKTKLLHALDLPALAYFQNEFEGYFVLIQQVNAATIKYFSPICGEVLESIEKFTTKWQGVLLVASTNENSYKGKKLTDKESIQGEIYKRNSLKVMDNFLNYEECRYIIDYCEKQNLFDRSKIQFYDNGESAVSQIRTSFSAFLANRQGAVFASVYHKVSKFLDVPVENIENLQCVRYSKEEEFKPHFDSGDCNHRIHTFLIYLNDSFKNGETYFPELNLKIKPKVGRALYFLDRYETGENILHSVHAGLPVKNGVKYACNIWVRNRPYEGYLKSYPIDQEEILT